MLKVQNKQFNKNGSFKDFNKISKNEKSKNEKIV